MLTGILVLATTLNALQQAQSPVHYRITLNASRNIDRTSSGEDARGGTYTAVAFVSASTTNDAGGRVAHVVIDSVACSGTGVMSMAFDAVVGQRSRGTRYDFAVGSRQEVIPTPTVSNILTNTLAQTALMLFPNIEPAAMVGSTWADSLDTSPMGDPDDKNHPVVTRWRVTGKSADTTFAEGDVRGSLSSTRVVSSGVVTGTRRLTVVGGGLRVQTSSTKTETLMVPEGATAITVGTATTSLEIVAVAGRLSP